MGWLVKDGTVTGGWRFDMAPFWTEVCSDEALVAPVVLVEPLAVFVFGPSLLLKFWLEVVEDTAGPLTKPIELGFGVTFALGMIPLGVGPLMLDDVVTVQVLVTSELPLTCSVVLGGVETLRELAALFARRTLTLGCTCARIEVLVP